MNRPLTHSARPHADRQRALRALVAGVAHELNTPLGIARTGVTLMLDRLADDDPEAGREAAADLAEAARLIHRNIERMHALVRRFGAMAIDEGGAVETVDLLAWLRARLRLLTPVGLILRLDCALCAAQRRYVGLTDHLLRALEHLLQNVSRHAYADGQGQVDVRLDRAGDAFCLVVEDFGRGIDAAALPRVFQPFEGRNRAHGAGLGLSIVEAAVVDGLGGRVEMTSALGRGTRVLLRLPACGA